ncbi:MAG: DUF1835 domain-containing protein [Gilvibacter sp.]
MVHILNGDSLLQQFPTALDGERIVCRECLVDGTLFPEPLEALFKSRSDYLDTEYRQENLPDYDTYAKAEFDKMLNLPACSEISLWFEDDVFCQINFWFCMFLLTHFEKSHTLYLVRPPKHTPYGFGGLSAQELLQAYKTRTKITSPKGIASLWRLYSKRDIDGLLKKTVALDNEFGFIHTAALAYAQSIPKGNDPGRPTKAVIAIKHELNTNQFGPVFKEFCQREAIYGYGDLQVKKIFDSILK